MIKERLGINTIIRFFTQGNERTLRAKKNISVSFLCKGATILINFIIVPLTLGYVGKVEYGVWMTISAFIQWFAFFDIGLGNGLRNKLSEALAKNNINEARVYISSVYAIIVGIAVLLFILFYIFSDFISWNKVLNVNTIPNQELFSIILIVFSFFSLGFVLNLLTSVLQALQRYALKDIIYLIAQVLGLLLIFILVKTTHGSLYYLCLVYGSQTVIVMLFASLCLYSKSLKYLRPEKRFVDLKKALPLLKLGLKFFYGQILYLIVNQSSIILVAQFFGPEDVTVFSIALRYMTISSMIFLMVLSPFLTAFTEAYAKNEFEWIRSTIRRINQIWILMSVGTVGMVLIYKVFFRLWVGDQIEVPASLIIGLAFSGILGSWGATYSLFLNSIAKLRMQLILLTVQAIVFIPLSYIFFKFGFGLVSIVLVQILFNISNVYFMSLQYNKVIGHKALGIWSR